MLIENKLKNLMISEYGSIKNFADKCNLPRSTINSILQRGVGNSNVSNIIVICNKLGLSVDALAKGEFVFVDNVSVSEDVSLSNVLFNKTKDLSPDDMKKILDIIDIYKK